MDPTSINWQMLTIILLKLAYFISSCHPVDGPLVPANRWTSGPLFDPANRWTCGPLFDPVFDQISNMFFIIVPANRWTCEY